MFTDAEKILLSKFNVDYLNSDKSELIENFTLKNLETNKDSKDEGNTKSVIFAPYNSYIESNDEENKENEDLFKIKKKMKNKNKIMKIMNKMNLSKKPNKKKKMILKMKKLNNLINIYIHIGLITINLN